MGTEMLDKKGVWFTALSYMMWGLLPMYWKLLEHVGPVEVLAHRVLWSFLFMGGWILAFRNYGAIKEAFHELRTNRKALWMMAGASFMITLNWLVFIFTVVSDRVTEASLGYYINPLVSAALGVLFLGETIQRSLRWSFAFAAAGVLVLIIGYGEVPWLALLLALSFGVYGLCKKMLPFGAGVGLWMETLFVLPLALVYSVVIALQGTASFGTTTSSDTLFLILAGVVTAIPLLAFATGAKRIPLTVVGLLQYIAPSSMLVLGVFVYGEAFTIYDLIAFCMIWIGLGVFTFGRVKQKRQLKRAVSNSI
ncbi:EamA family transporter RarD [Bacillus fonticola]|uniref:EamA family transporter RarD n=1 Tax=Bacillus fonticola TaxID=2728853 RepID=UPI0014757669|nr:EamA family transporter RarD [Bacillus fonticola]